MPKSNKAHYSQDRKNIILPSEWNIKISDKPVIKSTVPHPPKALKPVIIEDASTHIIDDMNPIKFCPNSCSFPND